MFRQGITFRELQIRILIRISILYEDKIKWGDVQIAFKMGDMICIGIIWSYWERWGDLFNKSIEISSW